MQPTVLLLGLRACMGMHCMQLVGLPLLGISLTRRCALLHSTFLCPPLQATFGQTPSLIQADPEPDITDVSFLRDHVNAVMYWRTPAEPNFKVRCCVGVCMWAGWWVGVGVGGCVRVRILCLCVHVCCGSRGASQGITSRMPLMPASLCCGPHRLSAECAGTGHQATYQADPQQCADEYGRLGCGRHYGRTMMHQSGACPTEHDDLKGSGGWRDMSVQAGCATKLPPIHILLLYASIPAAMDTL